MIRTGKMKHRACSDDDALSAACARWDDFHTVGSPSTAKLVATSLFPHLSSVYVMTASATGTRVRQLTCAALRQYVWWLVRRMRIAPECHLPAVYYIRQYVRRYTVASDSAAAHIAGQGVAPPPMDWVALVTTTYLVASKMWDDRANQLSRHFRTGIQHASNPSGRHVVSITQFAEQEVYLLCALDHQLHFTPTMYACEYFAVVGGARAPPDHQPSKPLGHTRRPVARPWLSVACAHVVGQWIPGAEGGGSGNNLHP
jgi:hypothetical protein